MTPFRTLPWVAAFAITLPALAAELDLAPVRPHSPWVFRSVLDERARMITIALHDDLWVAYDATDGSLYQAWKGGVTFDGAVYTTRHGPQPTSEGTPYVRTPEYPVGPWTLNGSEPTVRYLGYLRQGQESVEIKTELSDSRGRSVIVRERPSVRVEPDGSVVFVRSFKLDHATHGPVTVWLDTHDPEDHELVIDAPNRVQRTGRMPDGSNPNRWLGVNLDPEGVTTITMTLKTPENRP